MSVINRSVIFDLLKRGPSQLAFGHAPAKPIPPAEPMHRQVSVRALLDRVLDAFKNNEHESGPAMLELQSGLAAIRLAGDDAWHGVIAECLAHPVAQFLWQDPFTAHSFRKPRGYAGDAQLLDYIYGISAPPLNTTPLGVSIFNHMMAQQGALSVRSRGLILAELIDETALHRKNPRILSIACGHLREGLCSKALRDGQIGELVALDQDEQSLAEVDRTFAGSAVRTMRRSVRDILAGKVHFENYDLVYAAGLYDYLSDRVAARLTRIMFDMVAPGGRVLVANFAPRLPEVAYMETFMDWKLIYRTADQAACFADDISTDRWGSSRLFWDEYGNIVFLDLVKRGAPAGDRWPMSYKNRLTSGAALPALSPSGY